MLALRDERPEEPSHMALRSVMAPLRTDLGVFKPWMHGGAYIPDAIRSILTDRTPIGVNLIGAKNETTTIRVTGSDTCSRCPGTGYNTARIGQCDDMPHFDSSL